MLQDEVCLCSWQELDEVEMPEHDLSRLDRDESLSDAIIDLCTKRASNASRNTVLTLRKTWIQLQKVAFTFEV